MVDYYIYFTANADGFLGCVGEEGREFFVEHLKSKYENFLEIKIGIRFEEGKGVIREDSVVTNYEGKIKGVIDERIQQRVQGILGEQKS